MKRIDKYYKILIDNGRLYLTKKGISWIRIIQILGGQYRFETSEGTDLLFSTIDEAIKQIKKD